MINKSLRLDDFIGQEAAIVELETHHLTFDDFTHMHGVCELYTLRELEQFFRISEFKRKVA